METRDVIVVFNCGFIFVNETRDATGSTLLMADFLLRWCGFFVSYEICLPPPSLTSHFQLGLSFSLDLALPSLSSQREQTAVWKHQGSGGEDPNLQLCSTTY